MGCDAVQLPARPPHEGFNPRTRVGCDLFSRGGWGNLNGAFQSTHPRGVRQSRILVSMGTFFVSIHAPAWGATPRLAATCMAGEVFQSTHPRGVRPGRVLQRWRGFPSFNPRTRVGCDAIMLSRPAGPLRFQSTHPRGVRPNQNGRRILYLTFQSTHPRGVRPPVPPGIPPVPGFNPRTRVGCDQLWCRRYNDEDVVSIHAPAWGATRRRSRSERSCWVSIHAPAWGARPCRCGFARW